MSTKRVIMLFSHPLFGQGVETLLRRESGVEIVGRESDANRLLQRVKELRPDVVIVDGADPVCDPLPLVMRILTEVGGTRVIGLNLKDNSMFVYQGERRMVKAVHDLMQAIEEHALAAAA
jgi:DNA-binding NarL/FixJ family response regulator